jgi:hypothetical protein
MLRVEGEIFGTWLNMDLLHSEKIESARNKSLGNKTVQMSVATQIKVTNTETQKLYWILLRAEKRWMGI